MNTIKLIDILLSTGKYNDEEIEILKAIQETKGEIEMIKAIFNEVNDNELVDYAIYREKAANAKLSFLLKKAREKEIKLDVI